MDPKDLPPPLRDLEVALSQLGYYFSYDLDLSSPTAFALPHPGSGLVGAARGSEAEFDEEFCWNREIASELRALSGTHARGYAVPLIYGACHADKLTQAQVVIVARRSRRTYLEARVRADAQARAEATGLDAVRCHVRCCLVLEAQGTMVSMEVGESLVKSGGNIAAARVWGGAGKGVGEVGGGDGGGGGGQRVGEGREDADAASVIDALLDLLLAHKGSEYSEELQEESMEVGSTPET
jgi:hypothetical protein